MPFKKYILFLFLSLFFVLPGCESVSSGKYSFVPSKSPDNQKGNGNKTDIGINF